MQIILEYPPTQDLSSEESNLLWRFRFYLTRDKRALTKFLKSVRWSDRDEVKQAVDVLLPMWTDIEIGDALELLGSGEAFRDRRVRSFAVKQLTRADDDVSKVVYSTRYCKLTHHKSAGTHVIFAAISPSFEV